MLNWSPDMCSSSLSVVAILMQHLDVGELNHSFLFVRNLVFHFEVFTMKYWCYCFHSIGLSHLFGVRSCFLTTYNSLFMMLFWDFGGLWWSWIYNPTLDLSYYEWWYTIRCLGIYISVFEQLCLLFFFSIGLVR